MLEGFLFYGNQWFAGLKKGFPTRRMKIIAFILTRNKNPHRRLFEFGGGTLAESIFVACSFSTGCTGEIACSLAAEVVTADGRLC